jgi:predicted ferric reductase
MTLTLRGLARCGLWIGLYVLVVLFPVPWVGFAAAATRAFPDQLGAILGLLALSILAVQFALTARFRLLLPPFGADVLYTFHRGMALMALAFLVAHALLMLPAAELSAWLNPAGSGWAGAVALYLLVALAALAAGRRLLRLPYVPWRVVHGLLAAAVVVIALVHVASSGFLAHDAVTHTGLWIWILAWVLLLGWIRVVKPLLLRRHPYRVIGVRPEHGGAVTLVLDPEKLEGLRFRAGQFAWLTLDGSPFLARERPFFFSGSSQRGPRLELTVKAVGPFTRRVQDVKPGARAYVDGPLGHTSIDSFPDADRYFHVAGGIGVAPCISMLRTLADRGDRRPHTLVYGSADWESAAFREDLAELASRIDLKVVHVLEKPPLGWLGETGVIGPELLERHLPRSGRRVCFVCGPDAMMDATESALAVLGVPVEDIHGERLGWA